MSSFSRKRPASHPDEPTETVRTMHTASFSHAGPIGDHGSNLLAAEQAATTDIASGGIDSDTVASVAGPLTHEQGTAAVHSQAVADADRTRLQARVLSLRMITDTFLGRTIPPRGEASGSYEHGKRELAKATAAAAAATKEAAYTSEVLAGKRPDHAGARRLGTPITVEAGNYRRARIMDNIKSTAPFVSASVIEGLVVASNVYSAFRIANLLLATGIAVTVLLSLSLVPYVLGRTLAEARAHGKMPRADIIIVAVGALFWLGAGLTLALIRSSADAFERASTASAGPASGALSPPSPTLSPKVSSLVDGSSPIPTIFWIVVLLGVGVAVFLWENQNHNPMRRLDLAAREMLIVTDRWLRDLAQRLDEIAAEVRFQCRAAMEIDMDHEAQPQLIAAQRAEDGATYLGALVRAAGDPAMASAVDVHVATLEKETDARHGVPLPAFAPLPTAADFGVGRVRVLSGDNAEGVQTETPLVDDADADDQADKSVSRIADSHQGPAADLFTSRRTAREES
jgi:hypothetical protein